MQVSFDGEVEGGLSSESIWSALCVKVALSGLERRALEQCANGHLFKQVASDMCVTPSKFSRLLRSAASKLGLPSSIDALRLVGGLRRARAVQLESLTGAEREVFVLVKKGLSNQEIATLRCTSVRTVANQVAAVLAKTGLPSRRAIVASHPARESSSSDNTSGAVGRLSGSSSNSWPSTPRSIEGSFSMATMR